MLRHLRLGFVLALVAALALVPIVTAAVKIDTSALRTAVTLSGVRAHQQALATIAAANGGTRVAGGPGHVASAAYVKSVLESAGYTVTEQSFAFPYFEVAGPTTLAQTAPAAVTYTDDVDFAIMSYSGSGNVTAPVQVIENQIPSPGGSTSGCEAGDFPPSTLGKIALIQRGTCTFGEKAVNAAAAGAVGVVIYNEGNTPDREGLLYGTLGAPVAIPVVGTTDTLGEALVAVGPSLQLHLATDTISETRTTKNVIAETSGRSDRVVVVGAHLDSVGEGPGINDDGSGTAVILEIAKQIKAQGINPKNQIRFAWWSAEEEGLLGSAYYVSQLSPKAIKDISVMLDFDMLGSPNYVRFVYDGDGSDNPDAVGPNGSGVVEDVFVDYFGSMPTEPTAFDGRSDYAPFTAVGIPAGGVFTGAEGIKTAEEAAIYGGTAGAPYDPCYHQACDGMANNSDAALDQMTDATAHSVLTFGMTTSAVNGTDKSSAKAMKANLAKNLYRGSLLQR